MVDRRLTAATTGIIWHEASIEQGGSRGGGTRDQLGVVHVLGGADSRIRSTDLHARCQCGCPVLVPGDNRDRAGGPDGSHRRDMSARLRCRPEHDQVVDLGRGEVISEGRRGR
jgi:hypothetical protein